MNTLLFLLAVSTITVAFKLYGSPRRQHYFFADLSARFIEPVAQESHPAVISITALDDPEIRAHDSAGLCIEAIRRATVSGGGEP